MNIQAFSSLTQLSPHTIRYYEKIGLLPSIARNTSGHRHFTEKDIVWAEFIQRLKSTGMPLKNMLHYAELREQGPTTSAARMQILEEHATTLEHNIREEQNHLGILKNKIEYYREVINSTEAQLPSG